MTFDYEAIMKKFNIDTLARTFCLESICLHAEKQGKKLLVSAVLMAIFSWGSTPVSLSLTDKA